MVEGQEKEPYQRHIIGDLQDRLSFLWQNDYGKPRAILAGLSLGLTG